jgi:hypothetical protein
VGRRVWVANRVLFLWRVRFAFFSGKKSVERINLVAESHQGGLKCEVDGSMKLEFENAFFEVVHYFTDAPIKWNLDQVLIGSVEVQHRFEAPKDHTFSIEGHFADLILLLCVLQ